MKKFLMEKKRVVIWNNDLKILLKNEYFDYYDREITDENLNQKKKIEEMEIEIPSLNHKKNNSLRHIYENKLKDNSNKANKLNQRICTNNKEEEYSNLATYKFPFSSRVNAEGPILPENW